MKTSILSGIKPEYLKAYETKCLNGESLLSIEEDIEKYKKQLKWNWCIFIFLAFLLIPLSMMLAAKSNPVFALLLIICGASFYLFDKQNTGSKKKLCVVEMKMKKFISAIEPITYQYNGVRIEMMSELRIGETLERFAYNILMFEQRWNEFRTYTVMPSGILITLASNDINTREKFTRLCCALKLFEIEHDTAEAFKSAARLLERIRRRLQ